MSEQVYREQGKQSPDQVICPACKRPVVVEAATATCSHCDHRFAVASATTVVEYNATQNLALVLKDDLPPAKKDAAWRWSLAAGAVIALGFGGILFGATGFAVVLAIGVAIGYAVKMTMPPAGNQRPPG